jgi:predicted acylesterase/phospholipase RssA
MRFDAIVFSGGGCRCFWQAGFWSVVVPALDLRPRTVLGASAGSAFACAAVAGRIDEVVAAFTRRTAQNPRNAYPANVLRRRPVFPHEAIYRGTIMDTMDTSTLARLHRGPDLRILIARPPARQRVMPALLAGFVAYKLDGAVRRHVHPSLPRRLGFRPELVSVRDCQTQAELADLILQSSCMPPIIPLYQRDGEFVVDGAIVDGALVEAVADHASTLVLLSRPHAVLPTHPTRTYVQPSQPPPIAMWDYASPERIGPTFDLGRRDGEAFVASHGRRPLG